MAFMIILGIDPGKATSGYGLIEFERKTISLVDFGWIRTPKGQDTPQRLLSIFSQVEILIRQFSPNILSLERLFYFANAKTAMGVSEAMGVIKMAAAKKRVPVVEYAPLEIKRTVTGHGRAKKKEVKKAVGKVVKVRCPKNKKAHFDDVIDAIAVAICHAKKIEKNEKE